jgi:hypothetical protein
MSSGLFDYEKGVRTGHYHYDIFYHPSVFEVHKLGLPSRFPITIAKITDEKLLEYDEIIAKLSDEKKKKLESFKSGDICIDVRFRITNSLISGKEAIHDIATDGGRNPIIKS